MNQSQLRRGAAESLVRTMEAELRLRFCELSTTRTELRQAYAMVAEMGGQISDLTSRLPKDCEDANHGRSLAGGTSQAVSAELRNAQDDAEAARLALDETCSARLSAEDALKLSNDSLQRAKAMHTDTTTQLASTRDDLCHVEAEKLAQSRCIQALWDEVQSIHRAVLPHATPLPAATSILVTSTPTLSAEVDHLLDGDTSILAHDWHRTEGKIRGAAVAIRKCVEQATENLQLQVQASNRATQKAQAELHAISSDRDRLQAEASSALSKCTETDRSIFELRAALEQEQAQRKKADSQEAMLANEMVGLKRSLAEAASQHYEATAAMHSSHAASIAHWEEKLESAARVLEGEKSKTRSMGDDLNSLGSKLQHSESTTVSLHEALAAAEAKVLALEQSIEQQQQEQENADKKHSAETDAAASDAQEARARMASMALEFASKEQRWTEDVKKERQRAEDASFNARLARDAAAALQSKLSSVLEETKEATSKASMLSAKQAQLLDELEQVKFSTTAAASRASVAESDRDAALEQLQRLCAHDKAAKENQVRLIRRMRGLGTKLRAGSSLKGKSKEIGTTGTDRPGSPADKPSLPSGRRGRSCSDATSVSSMSPSHSHASSPTGSPRGLAHSPALHAALEQRSVSFSERLEVGPTPSVDVDKHEAAGEASLSSDHGDVSMLQLPGAVVGESGIANDQYLHDRTASGGVAAAEATAIAGMQDMGGRMRRSDSIMGDASGIQRHLLMQKSTAELADAQLKELNILRGAITKRVTCLTRELAASNKLAEEERQAAGKLAARSSALRSAHARMDEELRSTKEQLQHYIDAGTQEYDMKGVEGIVGSRVNSDQIHAGLASSLSMQKAKASNLETRLAQEEKRRVREVHRLEDRLAEQQQEYETQLTGVRELLATVRAQMGRHAGLQAAALGPSSSNRSADGAIQQRNTSPSSPEARPVSARVAPRPMDQCKSIDHRESYESPRPVPILSTERLRGRPKPKSKVAEMPKPSPRAVVVPKPNPRAIRVPKPSPRTTVGGLPKPRRASSGSLEGVPKPRKITPLNQFEWLRSQTVGSILLERRPVLQVASGRRPLWAKPNLKAYNAMHLGQIQIFNSSIDVCRNAVTQQFLFIVAATVWPMDTAAHAFCAVSVARDGGSRKVAISVVSRRARQGLEDSRHSLIQQYEFLDGDHFASVEAILTKVQATEVVVESKRLSKGDGKKLADIIEGCGAVARECSGKGTRKVDVDAALRKLCGEGELARAQNILRDPLSRDSFVALIDTYDLADNDEEEAKQDAGDGEPSDGSPLQQAHSASGPCFVLEEGRLELHMQLDRAAVVALNLLPTGGPASQGPLASLSGILGHGCQSNAGRRLMRRWVLQPLVDARQISRRQDAIAQLSQDASTFDDLGSQLTTSDLASIQRRLERKAAGLADVCRLYHAAGQLPTLAATIAAAARMKTDSDSEGRSQLAESATASVEDVPPSLLSGLADKLRWAAGQLDPLEKMVNLVVEDPTAPEPRVSAAYKPELAELAERLDAARGAVDELFEDIRGSWGAALEVKLHADKQHGFVLRAGRKHDKKVRAQPRVRVLGILKDGVHFTTSGVGGLQALAQDLMEIEEQYDDAQRGVVAAVVDVARSYTPVLEAAAEAVAESDALRSLAHLVRSARGAMCRPRMVQGGRVIRVRQARHPVVEWQDGVDFIPNDHKMQLPGGVVDKSAGSGSDSGLSSADASRSMVGAEAASATGTPAKGPASRPGWLEVITGPNMGGKSTYIRQLGAIAVMAQVGAWVPAETAELPIFDRVLCRLGAGDAQVRGVSTFMAEMLEAAAILEAATSRSLVIVDELGRGTSTYDGFGLGWAIAEHLATKVRCATLFATHFHELAALEDECPGVVNRHVAAQEEEEEEDDGEDEGEDARMDGRASSGAGISGEQGAIRRQRLPGQLTFLYQVRPGSCPSSFGIHVARMACFPDSVIAAARERALELEGLAKRGRELLLSESAGLGGDNSMEGGVVDASHGGVHIGGKRSRSDAAGSADGALHAGADTVKEGGPQVSQDSVHEFERQLKKAKIMLDGVSGGDSGRMRQEAVRAARQAILQLARSAYQGGPD